MNGYVSTEQEAVYVGAEKTASSAITEWMKREQGAHQVFVSQHSWSKWIYRDYFKFATVRNPYTRCVSMWAAFNLEIERGKKFRGYRGSDFDEFLRWQWRIAKQSTRRHQRLVAFYRRLRIDAWIPFESLPNSLCVLPFVLRPPDLRQVNIGRYAPPRDILSKMRCETICRIFRKDFRQFGYSLDPADMYAPPLTNLRLPRGTRPPTNLAAMGPRNRVTSLDSQTEHHQQTLSSSDPASAR